MRPLRQALRWDSSFWRQLARAGAVHGPPWFRRWAPAPIGLAFALWPSRQRATLHRRLRAIHGERGFVRDAVEIAGSYVGFAHSLTDSLAITQDAQTLIAVEPDGLHLLQQALAEGRGAIVATAHTAGWEVSLAALRRQCDAPIAVVMREERDRAARQLHATLACSTLLRVVEVGDDPFACLPLVTHLREGGIVAMQVDRCPNGMRCQHAQGEGIPWKLPAGPFVLAAGSGAPIVLALSRRCSYRSYVVHISEPVWLPKRPGNQLVQEAADRIASDLVRFIRTWPAQWFGFDE